LVPAQSILADFLGTFKEFPPRMKLASFSIDEPIQSAHAETMKTQTITIAVDKKELSHR
jgi:hypothetical protein